MTISAQIQLHTPVQSLQRTVASASDAVKAVSDLIAEDSALTVAFGRAVDLIIDGPGRLIICGIGKSGHIGRKIAATMASTGTPAFFVHPTEASHGDLGMIAPSDILLLLSWSGETAELTNLLAYAKRFAIPIVAITSRADSTLGRHADVLLCLPQITEACPHGLAPTTSTLLQLLIGDALAVALLERRGFTSQDFKLYHPGGKLGAQLLAVGELAHKGDELPIVSLGTSMGEAILVMSAKGFGVIGIVNGDGRLVGIITDGDLRRHMCHDLMSKPVDEIMSPNPRVVSATMLSVAVMKVLESARITVVFTVDEMNRPVGVVHVHDLLRAGVK